jgi:hypothetical protein
MSNSSDVRNFVEYLMSLGERNVGLAAIARKAT